MNKTTFLGFSVALVFGVVAFTSTSNVILTLSVFAITSLYFLFIVSKRFNQNQIKLSRFHECYHFINNFIVSLSIKGSVQASFENATYVISDSFRDVLDSIKEMNDFEKLQYLKKYFIFHSYYLFTDLVTLWTDEGGDILEMTTHLCNKLRQEEEYISFCESQNKKHIIEFSILWFITLTILFVLRFVLKDFYSIITKQLFFPISIGFLFLLILCSIDLATRKMTKIEIKGWKNERK